MILKNKKVLISIGAMSLLLLTGCSAITQFIPPSDETKYRFIEEGKDILDLESAGTIVSEEYDQGGGVISPAWYVAEVQGEDILEILKERLLNHPDINCERVRVTINDPNNGRG